MFADDDFTLLKIAVLISSRAPCARIDYNEIVEVLNYNQRNLSVDDALNWHKFFFENEYFSIKIYRKIKNIVL